MGSVSNEDEEKGNGNGMRKVDGFVKSAARPRRYSLSSYSLSELVVVTECVAWHDLNAIPCFVVAKS